jgi:hypothetical protein
MLKAIRIAPALLIGLTLALTARARAAEKEVRTFAVTVDGKPSGHYVMTIEKRDDGSVGISCDAHVKVKVAFVTAYHYDFAAAEVWKDGRVVSLQSTCDDDGKKYEVSATAGDKGLSVTVNGREKAVRGDAYLTTACVLVDARRREGALPLLEADNGQEIDGKIHLIGNGPITVAGQSVNTAHYRLNSLVAHEIWYDAGDRMVRQEWTEDGHKTVLELTHLKR